jgi:uncharacterized NAD(P)/FAD-binding protein YdhS
MTLELGAVKTVAIIGGGFCGTLAAVNLVRLSTKPLRVILVNYKYPLARGVAYGTTHPEHLLNVVARNMSAFPDLPSHFVDWLRTRAEFANVPVADLSEQFIPRQIYGDYLQSILFWQTQPLTLPGLTRIDVIDNEVLDIVPADGGARVLLKGGETLPADLVLLATGNRAPGDIMPPHSAVGHPAYCENPWRGWIEKLPDPREDVLLVGTGLTMIDAFLTLRTLEWGGTIYAVSRNALLPLSHFKGSDYPPFPPDAPWTLGLRALVALTEEHCARLKEQGKNPALVVDKLRPFTQRIWRSFSLAEKQEFCRQHRARWNVVRHRIPPSVARQIETAQKAGGLCILKGKLGAVQADGSRLRVTVDPGNGEPPHHLVVGLLVNCTGPRDGVANGQETLFQNLVQRGLVRSDELGMGIEVTPAFAVVGKDGGTSDFLFAVGPLLRGTLWETTAVPELRAQTYQVAQALLADDRLRHPEWAAETPPDLVEYCI